MRRKKKVDPSTRFKTAIVLSRLFLAKVVSSPVLLLNMSGSGARAGAPLFERMDERLNRDEGM